MVVVISSRRVVLRWRRNPFRTFAGLWGALLGPATVLAALRLSPTMSLGAMLGLPIAIAMIAMPALGLGVTSFVVPIERIGRLTSDSSTVTFSVMRILGLINLAAVVLHTVFAKKRIIFGGAVVLYGIYLFIAIVSLTYTSDFIMGVRLIGAMGGNLLFLFVILNIINNRSQIHAMLCIWLAASVLVGLYTIYDWHRGARVSDNRFNSTGERSTDDRFSTVLEDAAEFDSDVHTPRAMGPTSHPAVFAINNILTLPFFLYFVLNAPVLSHRIAAALGLPVILYCILLANTRASILTIGIMGLGLLVTGLVKISGRTLLIGAVALVCLLPLVPSAVWDRVLNFNNYSTSRSQTLSARMLYWGTALDVITENPVLGVGIGNQAEIPRRMRKFMAMPDNSTVHNEFLQSLLELGLVGYPVFLAFLGFVVHRAWRCRKRFAAVGDLMGMQLASAMFVSIVTTLIYGVQVDVLHFPLKGWWLTVGLMLVLNNLSRTSEVEGEGSEVWPLTYQRSSSV